MDQFRSVILLFFISQSVFATKLCDSSCNLQITFPTGGIIEAIEPITIVFGIGGNLSLGETGTINSSVQLSSTDFSSGGTLTLAAGESISFDANGSLQLGDAGNINYTNISISGDCTADITAIEGTQNIYLSQLSLTDNSTFNLSAQNIEISDVESSGSLTINGDENSNIFVLGIVTAYTLGINVGASNDQFVIGDITSASLDTSNVLGNGNLISSSSVNLTTNQPISTTTEPILFNTTDTFDLTNSTNWSINTAGIQLTDLNLPPDSLYLTVNGQSCSPLSGEDTPQCETDDGTTYQFIDGEWIELEATGMLSPISLVLLYPILYLRRKVFFKKLKCNQKNI